ncbi:MAG: PAS domain-containing sensor histidine kinase, partial [Thermomicrobiales bacterium]
MSESGEFQPFSGANDALGRAVWHGPGPMMIIERGSAKVLAANEAMLTMLGGTRDAIVGRPELALDIWEDTAGRERMVALVRGNEEFRDMPARLRSLDGASIAVLVTQSLVTLDDRSCVVLQLNDVTPLELARQELEIARDSALEADRTKSSFLSIISHELRTPLTAVMGYSQMLLAEAGGPLTVLQREDLVQIARGADRLLALIDDLLDLGRIQSGRIELDLKEVDITELLKSLEPDFRVQASAKGLSFWLLSEPGLTVLGDVRRLEQVILNLVSNAVK